MRCLRTWDALPSLISSRTRRLRTPCSFEGTADSAVGSSVLCRGSAETERWWCPPPLQVTGGPDDVEVRSIFDNAGQGELSLIMSGSPMWIQPHEYFWGPWKGAVSYYVQATWLRRRTQRHWLRNCDEERGDSDRMAAMKNAKLALLLPWCLAPVCLGGWSAGCRSQTRCVRCPRWCYEAGWDSVQSASPTG
jgi:hypothetical protein